MTPELIGFLPSRARKAWVWIVVQDLTPQLAQHFGTRRGVVVAEIEPGSPAAGAGLGAKTTIRTSALSQTMPREWALLMESSSPPTRIRSGFWGLRCTAHPGPRSCSRSCRAVDCGWWP